MYLYLAKIRVILLFLQVKALAQGQDRRVELGYKLGMELKGKLKSSSMSQ